MSRHVHTQRVPRGVLVAAGLMMVTSIALAAGARSARRDEVPPPMTGDVVELRFEDRVDGSVAVFDARTAREVVIVAPGQDGFIRGVMRGLNRTRKLESIDRQASFRLSREPDGRFVLEDPESGHRVELRSFGRTNYEAFVRLYEAARST
jgi:putative photosynthetic complex assembly protein